MNLFKPLVATTLPLLLVTVITAPVRAQQTTTYLSVGDHDW